jgi:hypothetical protein
VICAHLDSRGNGFLLFIAGLGVTILAQAVKNLLLLEIMLYNLPYVKVLNMQYTTCVVTLGDSACVLPSSLKAAASSTHIATIESSGLWQLIKIYYLSVSLDYDY